MSKASIDVTLSPTSRPQFKDPTAKEREETSPNVVVVAFSAWGKIGWGKGGEEEEVLVLHRRIKNVECVVGFHKK